MKKIKEIEFNAELIGKEGIVIKYRNGEVPLQVVWMDKLPVTQSILSIAKDNQTIMQHSLNGFFFLEAGKSSNDLIMFKEVEVKEPRVIWVNMYNYDSMHVDNYVCANKTKEEAVKVCPEIAKTVKFIEVIEEGE